MLDLLELKSCILDILKGNSNVNKNLEKFVNKSAKAAERFKDLNQITSVSGPNGALELQMIQEIFSAKSKNILHPL